MEQKGSFIGFTFGNRHSSKLGILRTSDSGRYSTNLSPQAKEIMLDLNTTDGTYYWGSNYVKREIPISFAFYGLTEEQIQQLKRVFNDKKIHPLILDEEPYKVWSAKLTGTAICKHICLEQDGQRFYCGEGTFTFTAFYPFARSRYEYIEDYIVENIHEWIDAGSLLVNEFEEGIIYPAILSYGYTDGKGTGSIIGLEDSFNLWLEDTDLLIDSDIEIFGINSFVDFFIGNGVYYNLDEWREASKIPSSEVYGIYSQGVYKLYNAGDVDMPFQLFLSAADVANASTIENGENKLELAAFTLEGGDTYVMYDSISHVLQGCDSSYKKTNNLYNKYIISGNFFNLPVGEVELKTPQGILKYKYLYL